METRKVLRAFSTPITLIILLGLLIGGTFWGYKAVTAKVPGPAVPTCEDVSLTVLEPSSVTINVLNGGSQRGLAGRIADHLEEHGFLIKDIDNTDPRVLTVLILGSSADNPEVQLVAGWFVDPQIEGDGRVDHTVDVIVGNSFSEKTGFVAEPPLSIEIPSGKVCLPPSATPTPVDTPTPTDGVTPSGTPT